MVRKVAEVDPVAEPNEHDYRDVKLPGGTDALHAKSLDDMGRDEIGQQNVNQEKLVDLESRLQAQTDEVTEPIRPEGRLSYTITIIVKNKPLQPTEQRTTETAHTFTEFIRHLRRILADHPDHEDICDYQQEDTNLPSSKNHPLLAKKPLADLQPARWIHVKLQVVEDNGETKSTTLVIRDDNVDVMGFSNQEGKNWYELGNNRCMLPPEYKSVLRLNWGNSYQSILNVKNEKEVAEELKSAKLGKTFATNAVRVLSRYPDEVDGIKMTPRLAVAGLMFMISESAKMKPVYDAITRGWDTEEGIKGITEEELMMRYVGQYVYMSRTLREWKQREYPEPKPDDKLRDAICLVLNEEFTMGDLLSFAYPETLESSFPAMFKKMYMATDVQVNLQRVSKEPKQGRVYGKIRALIRDEQRNSVSFQVGSMLFRRTRTKGNCQDWSTKKRLKLVRSVVVVPSGWALLIEVDLRIQTGNNNSEPHKLNAILDCGGIEKQQQHRIDARSDEFVVEVTTSWRTEVETPEVHIGKQLSSPVEVMMSGKYLTVVYTIGDALSFTEFIMALRRIVADHPNREDILDEHPGFFNISSTRQHPVLAKQRAAQPARWLHIKLQVEGEEAHCITLLMRDDNLYVFGFINKHDVYELVDNKKSAQMLPKNFNNGQVQRLKWTVEYSSLMGTTSSNEAGGQPDRKDLGKIPAKDAVRMLSSYKYSGADDEEGGKELARLIFMVCESARFNHIHDSIVDGWSKGIVFTKELKASVWDHGVRSGKLRVWKSGGYVQEPHVLPLHIKNLKDLHLVLNTSSEPKGKKQVVQDDNKDPPPPNKIENKEDKQDEKPNDNPPPPPNTGGGHHPSDSDMDNSGGPTRSSSDDNPPPPPNTSGGHHPSDSGGSHDSKPEEASDADIGDPTSSSSDDTGHGGGNSGSQPGEESEEDQLSHGRPRVELLAIRADLQVKGTEIIVFDGRRGQIIYTKEEIEQEEDQGGMVDLVLTGPYKGISAYGCFAICIDIPAAAAAAGGSNGDAGSDTLEWEWDCYNPKYAAQVDDETPNQHTIHTRDGCREVAKITYAVMSNALEATVEVFLRLQDGQSPGGLHGVITAYIGDFEDGSVLFRTERTPQSCSRSPNNDGWWCLNLARNLVAVPCGKLLRVKVDLKLHCHSGMVLPLKGTLEFNNGVSTAPTLNNVNGDEVKVNITWYPEIPRPSHPPEQITIKEPDEHKSITSSFEQSGPVEAKKQFVGQLDKEYIAETDELEFNTAVLEPNVKEKVEEIIGDQKSTAIAAPEPNFQEKVQEVIGDQKSTATAAPEPNVKEKVEESTGDQKSTATAAPEPNVKEKVEEIIGDQKSTATAAPEPNVQDQVEKIISDQKSTTTAAPEPNVQDQVDELISDQKSNARAAPEPNVQDLAEEIIGDHRSTATVAPRLQRLLAFRKKDEEIGHQKSNATDAPEPNIQEKVEEIIGDQKSAATAAAATSRLEDMEQIPSEPNRSAEIEIATPRPITQNLDYITGFSESSSPAGTLKMQMVDRHQTLVYTIGDSMSFMNFINALSDMTGHHLEREDIDQDSILPTGKPSLLLARPRAGEQPARWLHIKLQVVDAETWTTTLVMRDDNLYVQGFRNKKGDWFEIGDRPWNTLFKDRRNRRVMLPPEYNATLVRWGLTYRNILKARNRDEVANKLDKLGMDKKFAKDAVRVLSRYPEQEVVTDGVDPRQALVGLLVMVRDSLRFQPVCDKIRRGWDGGQVNVKIEGLSKELFCYISNWFEISRALLDWKDHGFQEWPRNRRLESIGIESAQQALDVVRFVLNVRFVHESGEIIRGRRRVGALAKLGCGGCYVLETRQHPRQRPPV